MEQETFLLDGSSLSIHDVLHLVGNPTIQIGINSDTSEKIRRARGQLENAMTKHPFYGINTGCGNNKGLILFNEQGELDLEALLDHQRYYTNAHSFGVGRYLPDHIVRTMILLRVYSFTKGYSGVTLELCQSLLDLLNLGLIPQIPMFGSVGASGDLIPLAHLGAVLTGIPETHVKHWDLILPTPVAFKKTGFTPYTLKAKEALALTNGATLILAHAIMQYARITNLMKTANIAAALSLEAIRGCQDAFDPRIHAARNHPGQIHCAQVIRRMIRGSKRCSDMGQAVNLTHEAVTTFHDPDGQIKKTPRIQDAYSFRCAPQVHGATLDVIENAIPVFSRELQAATDNPLIFISSDGTVDVLSGGNFHGQPLAFQLDFLGIAMSEIGNISNSRLYLMLSSSLSGGLPPNLQGPGNSNTGLMIMQYMTASRASANKHHANPASTDSIPTSGGQEDHVSMGSISADKLWPIILNLENILGAELYAAARAIAMTSDHLSRYNADTLGIGTSAVFDLIRGNTSTPPVDWSDHFYHPDLMKVIELVSTGEIVRAAEKTIGNKL